ncbi:hypothetical protein BsWGS_22783 [Bradybaena similaris]
MVAHNSTNVKVFYGIPYAKPPVGELRFKGPEPAAAWPGTRDATILPNACWQAIDTSFNRFPMVEMWNPNTNMSEDCLYLNVWIPDNPGPKAMMVWIYGGGFYSGSSTLDVYNGLALAARGDVVVVSLNYRLGPFGFLYCGTPDCPGNVGLLDQALAMKFVKDNAKNLGGDPRQITIFGESAGAISAGLHLLSPVSMDLFTNAILMSGAPQVVYVTQNPDSALNRTKQLACHLDCSIREMSDIVSRLRTANPQELTDLQWKVKRDLFIDLAFSPVVDGNFLLKHPLELMAEGKVKNTSIVTGVVTDEGTYFLLYRLPDIFSRRDPSPVSRSQFDTVVREILKSRGSSSTAESIKRLTMNEYYYSVPPGARGSYRDAADDIAGDIMFKCGVVDFARFYSTRIGGRAFVYSYEHRASTNSWPKWMGVPHGYELEIFFGQPWLGKGDNYTVGEREFSGDIMTRISNFAKQGDPNSGLTPPTVNWPAYTTEDQHYLVMTGGQMRVDQGLRHRECEFWRTQVPIFQEASDPRTTCTPSISERLCPTHAVLVLLLSIVTVCNAY